MCVCVRVHVCVCVGVRACVGRSVVLINIHWCHSEDALVCPHWCHSEDALVCHHCCAVLHGADPVPARSECADGEHGAQAVMPCDIAR
jgi:hypothetical protein